MSGHGHGHAAAPTRLRAALHVPGQALGHRVIWAVAFALAFALAACRGGCGPHQGEQEIVVFAASSLTEAFAELERVFERDHPGVDVILHLAGSQALRLQIEQGAPADVFASADARHMDALAAADHVSERRRVAANELVVVVPRGNPAKVRSFHDLPRAERIVVGAPEVPVGAYTRTIFEQSGERVGADFRARVEQHIVSREANVRLVLAKVELGEADAAVVYRTDAMASRRVHIVEIPAELAQRADYHIGVATRAQRPELARAWLELVVGPTGQRVLAGHGFMVAAR